MNAENEGGRFLRGLRYGLILSLFLWSLLFLAGCHLAAAGRLPHHNWSY